MQNIENITLANWQDSSAADLPVASVYHFAIRQSGVNLDFHLGKFFRGERVSFHYFDDFTSLISICRRYPVAAIAIGCRTDLQREIELIHSIKNNVFLSIVPVILYHPEPDYSMIVAAYQNGAEEFIYGEWLEKIVEVRVRRVIERNRRDLAVNPSTRLPGPAMIEDEIERQILRHEEFAVGYADLDNFKAFNDYYGYASGDKIIKLSARILRDVVFDLCREGFVGHIAGDDFIFVAPKELVDNTCRWIIKTFDAVIPYRYKEEDRDRGSITTTNRKGEIEQFPILTISIAVVQNEDGRFKHVGEMSKMLADLKRAVKQKPGSNYMLERRKKY